MSKPLLGDAFGHHVWATKVLIDTCLTLTPEQLAITAPGTYGSILDTMRHLVGADAGYLFALTSRSTPEIDEAHMGLPELRVAMEANDVAWSELLAGDLDAETDVVRHRDDGSDSHAPLGIRLAQALHHGTDHRSQICTGLTMLGVEPPAIDVWDYAWLDRRIYEVQPAH